MYNILERLKSTDGKTLNLRLRLLNVFFSFCQIMAGITGIMNMLTFDIAGTMLSIYAILFAGLFILLELHLPSTEKMLRENLGFMFTHSGKIFYLLFIGLLDIGLGNPLGVLSGVMLCLSAGCTTLLLFIHPTYPENSDRTPAALKLSTPLPIQVLSENPTSLKSIISPIPTARPAAYS